MTVMRYLGIFLCCQSALGLSFNVGLAIIAQQIDALESSYYNSAFTYITALQWICIVIPLVAGCGMLFVSGKQSKDARV